MPEVLPRLAREEFDRPPLDLRAPPLRDVEPDEDLLALPPVPSSAVHLPDTSAAKAATARASESKTIRIFMVPLSSGL